jgi:ParB family transcriptional regulator, chromosome partitioning protein
MSKLLDKTAGLSPNQPLNRPSRSESARTAPGRMFEVANRINEAEDRANAAEAHVGQLQGELEHLRGELLASSNAGSEIALDQLVEVPGRRRKMTQERYAELRENLRNNKLIHPVVVRRADDGRYEIVSGHHRADAYRELGHAQIRCVVIEGSDDEVTDGAFNANLMQSALTDYEKFLGFKIRLERSPGITQNEIAERFGVTQAAVSKLFSFDQLPLDALSVIESKPEIIGSAAVATLASIAKKGAADRVVEVVKRLASGEIDQTQAIRFAGLDPNKAAKHGPAPVSVKIKHGKATYCELRRAKNVVRLEFKSEGEAEEIQAALQELLEARSKSSSANSQK